MWAFFGVQKSSKKKLVFVIKFKTSFCNEEKKMIAFTGRFNQFRTVIINLSSMLKKSHLMSFNHAIVIYLLKIQ